MKNNSENPDLVIVLPTKDRRTLLERALGSVREQSYQNYRVVIINDGSNDSTRQYLDTLADLHVQVIHHEKARGVNAARNAAFKTLKEGEWAVQLDDDDMLLPNALMTTANVIAKSPPHIQVLCFNAITRTPEEEYVSGLQFERGEEWFDPTYENLMLGIRTRGDTRMVLKWTLFPKYLFAEDINGFEGEWWLLLGHDGIGIRYLPEQTTLIDQAHGSEQLSNVAGRRDPASFVRAYRRIFHTHAKFFRSHPRQSMPSAMSATKFAIRAVDISAALYFFLLYIRGFLKLHLGTKRPKEEKKR